MRLTQQVAAGDFAPQAQWMLAPCISLGDSANEKNFESRRDSASPC